jgi:hypothetical protein
VWTPPTSEHQGRGNWEMVTAVQQAVVMDEMHRADATLTAN